MAFIIATKYIVNYKIELCINEPSKQKASSRAYSVVLAMSVLN